MILFWKMIMRRHLWVQCASTRAMKRVGARIRGETFVKMVRFLECVGDALTGCEGMRN